MGKVWQTHTLNKVLEDIGMARDDSVNVKGKEVKKSVAKINKKTKLALIYKKLNI